MIVVDSSTLIAFFRKQTTASALRLRDEVDADHVVIGDIVLLEVLQGARSDRHACEIGLWLRRFKAAEMMSFELASKAAANYRRLRELGFRVQKTPDLVIATFCIENGHALLHQDRDFDPMAEHLGLLVA